MTREEYQKLIFRCKRNKPKELQTANCKKYPQKYFKAKPCKQCGKVFIPNAPSELSCSEECRIYLETESYYKRVYGLTIEEYLNMAEQQGFVCRICGKENFPMKECSSGALVVDHDHLTGEIRGLLCHNCNRALGLFHDSKENLSNAISYLERVTTIPEGSTR